MIDFKYVSSLLSIYDVPWFGLFMCTKRNVLRLSCIYIYIYIYINAIRLLPTETNSRAEQIGTIIHELSHALAFSPSLFPYFRRPLNGAPWGIGNVLSQKSSYVLIYIYIYIYIYTYIYIYIPSRIVQY